MTPQSQGLSSALSNPPDLWLLPLPHLKEFSKGSTPRQGRRDGGRPPLPLWSQHSSSLEVGLEFSSQSRAGTRLRTQQGRQGSSPQSPARRELQMLSHHCPRWNALQGSLTLLAPGPAHPALLPFALPPSLSTTLFLMPPW